MPPFVSFPPPRLTAPAQATLNTLERSTQEKFRPRLDDLEKAMKGRSDTQIKSAKDNLSAEMAKATPAEKEALKKHMAQVMKSSDRAIEATSSLRRK